MSIRNVLLFWSSDLILDNMVASKQLESNLRDRVSSILLRHHHHQHDKREGRGLPLIRSLAEIGKRSSDKHMEDKGEWTSPCSRRRCFRATVGGIESVVCGVFRRWMFVLVCELRKDW